MQRSLLAAVAIVCGLTAGQWVSAQNAPSGTVIATPDKMVFKPSPRVAGAEIADLLGDATKQGAYVQRIRLPANFKIQPHTHPEERTYTIISGTWYVGYGDKFDETKMIALPPGSFYIEPANVPHFVATKAEPVVFQLTGIGPTATKMLEPK